jgi:ubiquinone/menaquinone biosynthesis C-methylase UbiE
MGRGKMLEDRPEDAKLVKKKFDEISRTYDEWERTFEGRLVQELEWERLVKDYLPEDRSVRILDAGGGTGWVTLPLTRMGYKVMLSDLSPGMLRVAREKLQGEGLLDRVEIKEADLASLPFRDETVDLVVCLHGAFSCADSLQAAKELTRVMKRGAMIIVSDLSRYGTAVHEFNKNPEAALKLLKSEVNHAYTIHGDWERVFSPEELKGLFEKNSIKVIKIYGSFIFQLYQEILERQKWDNKFFTQVVEIMMYLREEPSLIGMAPKSILVGEKR